MGCKVYQFLWEVRMWEILLNGSTVPNLKSV